MSRASKKEKRQTNDFYETPPWLTRAVMPLLAPMLPKDPLILEPAAGAGAIIDVVDDYLTKAGKTPDIHACDIAPRRDDIAQVDFLNPHYYRNGKVVVLGESCNNYDLVITNPPYLTAQDFIRYSRAWLAPDGAGLIAMLLRINFLGSQKRAKWMRANVPHILAVSPKRPRFSISPTTGKLGSDATEYAWFIWDLFRRHPEKHGIHILETEDIEGV